MVTKLFRNFLWGIVLFILNIFLIYQNYVKGFSFSVDFFIESNQIIMLIIGVLYANECRKLNFKTITGIFSNSVIFSILLTILFALYESPVTITFTALIVLYTFICIFISYYIYYWLFCPDKHKKKYKQKKKKNN